MRGPQSVVPGAGGPRPRRDPRNVPGSGWVPTSPPVAFPLYGLDASWPGARWLNQFGDELEDPPRWLALAHESADGQSLIMVTTYSRAAVSDGADDVYLAAVGVGTGPEGLSLARLRDGGAYHFDLAQPLNPQVMAASRESAGVQVDEPGRRRQDWHADQLRLMREPRPSAAE